MKFKKAYIIVLALFITVGVAGLVLANRADDKTKTEESNISSEDSDEKKNTSSSPLKAGETLRSQAEYDKYVQSLNKSLLGTVLDKDFDWNTKAYVPITFILSPGESIVSATLSDENTAEITVMGAAKGCVLPQVQRIQYVFIEVPKDFEGPLNSSATVVKQDNPESCPF